MVKLVTRMHPVGDCGSSDVEGSEGSLGSGHVAVAAAAVAVAQVTMEPMKVRMRPGGRRKSLPGTMLARVA